MSAFRAALAYDDLLRADANAAGANYAPVYYTEILSRLGLPHDALAPAAITAQTLEDYSALLLPPLPPGHLSAEAVEAIAAWVEAGGLLVGFAAPGLGGVFGIDVVDLIVQAGDEFTAAACVRLNDPEWTRGLLPPYDQECSIPIVAPVQVLSAPECRELARLLTFFERDTGTPAITYRQVGRGAACYFAFDLGHCMLAMHQGRPVWEDYDGDGWLRTSDQVATRPFPADVPYSDLLMFTLRRVIAEHGGVFLHQLPPTADEAVPDAVFHWGGDDEGATDVQLPAAEFMADLGLPYHINIMPEPIGHHPLPRETFDRLTDIGCETSIHFNFITDGRQPYAFSRDDLAEQLADYQAAYNQTPVCTVFHCATWTGWADPARWLAELGLKGDNNRLHRPFPPKNPTNKCNYAFGTAYPFHYYDDHAHQNGRIDFTSQPITAYECGYVLGERTEFSQLHRAIEQAGFWHLTQNMFFHPIRLTEEHPREAVREALRYCDELGLNALHFGTDELCLWWHARAASSVDPLADGGEGMTLRTRTDWPEGCIVQMLWRKDTPPSVLVNGQPAGYLVREEYGCRWLYIACPTADAEVYVGK